MAVIDHRNKTLLQEGEPFVVRNYRIRAYPSKQLQQDLAKVFGHSRFVYNRLLAISKQAYQDHLANPTLVPKPDVSPFGLDKQLTTLKNTEGYEWLYEVSNGPLQAASHNLGGSYKNFFSKRSKAPKFKKKYHEQTAYFPGNCFAIESGLLTLAKTDQPLRLRGTRALPSYPLGVTVTKTCTGKYFVTFTVKVPKTRKSGKGTIGIDLGIKDYAVFSDGTKITNPRHFLKLQQKLAHEQRMLSKKRKGSSNRNKQRIKVARLHERITNTRNDFLHKLTAAIVSENQAIVVEALKVVNMLRNHKLAKHIADASWSKFKQMLMSKVQETSSGCLVIADSFFPSTQTCSTCGTKSQVKLTLSAREWECPTCHSHHDRDVNAAMNLELLGKKVLLLAKQGLIPEGKQIYLSSDYGTLVHSS